MYKPEYFPTPQYVKISFVIFWKNVEIDTTFAVMSGRDKVFICHIGNKISLTQ